jgi:hypothetical protein
MIIFQILDENHELVEVGLLEWASWYDQLENRKVDHTEVGEYEVSTIYMGFDLSCGIGPPQLFETMVFLQKAPVHDYTQCYSTWKEAKHGHEEIVKKLRESGDD